MKAIILARVSTKEQEEQGHSLPAQIRRLQEYAKKKDFEIVETFSFSESAGDKIRKKFEEVLKYLKDHEEVEILLCENVDRVTRNFRDAVDLDDMRKNKGLEIHFVQDGFFINKNATGNQMFMWEAKVFIAKQYLNRLSDDVKRSNEQKIQNGQWITKAPVGYVNTVDNKGNKDIIPDPLRSHFIVKIYEMYASGNYSIQRIKNEVDPLGLKSNTKNPKPLSKSIIYHILKNPFYHGIMRINAKLYPHKYAPLITRQLFDKAQAVMAGYHKKPFRYGCKPFAFRGLIKCADCGCTITAEQKKGKYNYYSCTNYKRVHKDKIYLREEELLTQVYEVLQNIKLTDKQINDLIADLRRTNESKDRFFESAMEGLRAEYDKYEKKKSNLLDRFVDEEITKEAYGKQLAEYETKQADINTETGKHHKADEEYYITVGMILSLAQRAYQILKSSEAMEKRQLLNFLLRNCQLRGKKLEFTLKTPFNRVLETDSRSNWLRG